MSGRKCVSWYTLISDKRLMKTVPDVVGDEDDYKIPNEKRLLELTTFFQPLCFLPSCVFLNIVYTYLDHPVSYKYTAFTFW